MGGWGGERGFGLGFEVDFGGFEDVVIFEVFEFVDDYCDVGGEVVVEEGMDGGEEVVVDFVREEVVDYGMCYYCCCCYWVYCWEDWFCSVDFVWWY